MNKIEFFLKAMEAGLYKKKAWVISAFSLIREDFSNWKNDPYPYRIVQTPTGSFFVDPDNKDNLLPIDGSLPNEPVFIFKEPIELKANQVPNLKKDITSTIGNVYFNYCCLVHSFGNKFEYIEGKVNLKAIENKIAELLQDTPVGNEVRDSRYIYVDEYINFADSLLFITNFTQLCVWGGTAKTMTPPPGIKEFKAQLIEKYKDNLSDPSVIALIDAELVKFDSEYLKGDAGENFLLDGKAKKARKRLFLMYGAEAGFGASVGVDLIQNSLMDGWELDKFPTMNNALRAGSYNRGAETRLGGESVKWLLRASSNIVVSADDCGSKLGKKVTYAADSVHKLIGFNVVTENGFVTITKETDLTQYVDKTIMVRSPMYCKMPKTDFCKTCIGKNLALNPTGLSIAVSEYGSNFLGIFLSMMHTKALSLAKYDYKKHLS